MNRLITDEVLDLIGSEVTYRAPEPLSAASIRHYVLAIGADPDRWSDEAPPTLLCDTTELTGNRVPDDDGYLGHTWELPFSRPTMMIRGGNDYTFHQPVRAGDLITTVWRLDAITERTDAGGTPMAIVTTTATYLRDDEMILATNVETQIHRPAAPPGAV